MRNLTVAASAVWRYTEKLLYRCTSTLKALNYCSGILLKIFLLSIRSCVHKHLRLFFGLFVIFDHNFAKIVVPPSNKNEIYLAHLKEQSMSKNDENGIKIDP